MIMVYLSTVPHCEYMWANTSAKALEMVQMISFDLVLVCEFTLLMVSHLWSRAKCMHPKHKQSNAFCILIMYSESPRTLVLSDPRNYMNSKHRFLQMPVAFPRSDWLLERFQFTRRS